MTKYLFLSLFALLSCFLLLMLAVGCDHAREPAADTTADAQSGAAPFPASPIAAPVIIQSKYPASDVIIADIVATEPPYGADPTGVGDSTAAIRRALNACRDHGGGTVWLPAGKYIVTGTISIPAYVTLRGDWQDPDIGSDYGTIILASPPGGDTATPALFEISGSAGVMGLTVYYPEQRIDKVKPYPFTFYVNGMGEGYMLQSIVNCTVINGYRGIGVCVDSGVHEQLTVDTVKGTFLYTFAEVYNQADVGTWKNVTVDNRYWAEAGAGLNAASRNELDAYTRAHATGMIIGDLEWAQFANLSISDCRIGIHIVKGKRIEFAGALFDVRTMNCDIGLQADAMDSRWGTVVARSHLSGSLNSVVNNSDGVIKLSGVSLDGEAKGKGSILLDNAPLEEIPVDYFRAPAKPAERLTVLSADRTGRTDIGAALQQALTAVGEAGGGVVYLPAGRYLLTAPVTVPVGVELRGASSVAQREMNENSGGTLILVKTREVADPDTAEALITLAGENAGVRGVRFFLYRQ